MAVVNSFKLIAYSVWNCMMRTASNCVLLPYFMFHLVLETCLDSSLASSSKPKRNCRHEVTTFFRILRGHFEEFVPVVRRRPFQQRSAWPKCCVHHCYWDCCSYPSSWHQDWQWHAKMLNQVAFGEPRYQLQRPRRTERH